MEGEKMRIVTIDFSDEKNKSVKNYIDCGFEGEHLATRLDMIIPEYIPDNAVYRLSLKPGGQTGILESSNRHVYYEIPKKLTTQHTVAMSLEAYVGSERVFKAKKVNLNFNDAVGEMPQIADDDPIRREVTSNTAAVKKLENEKLNKSDLGDEFENFINNTKYLDEFSNALTNTVSGNTFTIDDISPVKHDVKIKVHGKNEIKFPYDNTEQTVNGVTFKVNSDGSIKALGNGEILKDYANIYLNENIDLIPNNMYSVGKHTIVMCYVNGKKKFFGTWNSPFIWKKEFKNPAVYVEYSVGESVVNDTIYPQLVSGDETGPYEKYINPLGTAVRVTNSFTSAEKTFTADENGLGIIPSYCFPGKIELVDSRFTADCIYNADINSDNHTGNSIYKIASDNGYAGSKKEFYKELSKKTPEKTSELKNDSGFISKSIIDDTKVSKETLWSSEAVVKNILSTMSLKGSLVNFKSLQNYNISVITHLEKSQQGYETLSLVRCGKNLIESTPGVYKKSKVFYPPMDLPKGNYTITSDISSDYEGNTLKIIVMNREYADQMLVPVYNNSLTVKNISRNSNIWRTDILSAKDISSTQGHTLTVRKYMIESGGTASEYEPYKGNKYTVTFPKKIYKGTYNWITGELNGFTDLECTQSYSAVLESNDIRPFSGVNNIFSSEGETQVDFVLTQEQVKYTLISHEIQLNELKNAMLLLGGNN